MLFLREFLSLSTNSLKPWLFDSWPLSYFVSLTHYRTHINCRIQYFFSNYLKAGQTKRKKLQIRSKLQSLSKLDGVVLLVTGPSRANSMTTIEWTRCILMPLSTLTLSRQIALKVKKEEVNLVIYFVKIMIPTIPSPRGSSKVNPPWCIWQGHLMFSVYS